MIDECTKHKILKKIQTTGTGDRPRPLLFESFNQRFPPLVKRVNPVRLYHTEQ